tara:strand:+ start:1247 stop:1825 length:579 start_codon:yes stop_codon:yes gene_type:complete
MALTKINNNTLSAVTTLPAAIATGKVLQVVGNRLDDAMDVLGTEDTQYNIQGGAGVFETAMTIASGSKVYVNYMFHIGTDTESANVGLLVKAKVDSGSYADVAIGDASGSRTRQFSTASRGATEGGGGYWLQNISGNVLFTPSGSGSRVVTVKFMLQNRSSGNRRIYNNYSYTNEDDSVVTVSTCTLMEVGS